MQEQELIIKPSRSLLIIGISLHLFSAFIVWLCQFKLWLLISFIILLSVHFYCFYRKNRYKNLDSISKIKKLANESWYLGNQFKYKQQAYYLRKYIFNDVFVVLYFVPLYLKDTVWFKQYLKQRSVVIARDQLSDKDLRNLIFELRF